MVFDRFKNVKKDLRQAEGCKEKAEVKEKLYEESPLGKLLRRRKK